MNNIPDNMESKVTPNGSLPFDGITVVEFTTAVAGPLVGKVLADYGARVIVVESEAALRAKGSAREPATTKKGATLNAGHLFNKCGTNKLSVTLNLQKAKGIELARRLIEKADVVIDNFPPRVLQKWGLTYDELVKMRPNIIMLRFPTVSTRGMHAHQNSSSWNVMAMAGLNLMSGYPEAIPIPASRYSYPDESSSPFHASAALLAALYWRAKTGQGQYIEISIYEGAVALAGLGLLEYQANRKLPRRMANRAENAAPHGVYPCRGPDRWCTITVFNDAEWASLCRATGMHWLLTDKRFETLEDRKGHEDELDRIIGEWTAPKDAREVMDLLQASGVAAAMVENADDLLNWDPQLRDRDFWRTTSHPEADKLVGAGWGFKLSSAAVKNGRPPLLGEQNDYVLGELIGLSEEEINQYIVDGVIY